jgi:small-conductance mechanosensitive channel
MGNNMSLLVDLDKMRKSPLAVYLICAAMLSPGLLFIYLFKPDLFNNLDIWRLLFLSISIIMPVFLLNLVIFVANPFFRKGINTKEEEGNWFMGMIMLAAIFTILFIYLIIAVRIFLKFDTKTALIVIAGIELIQFVALLVDWVQDEIKKHKKPPK